MIRRWNYDKKHRCPQCHAIWVYAPKYEAWAEKRKPHYWPIHDCYACGARFAGWGWDDERKHDLRRLGIRFLFIVVTPFLMGSVIGAIMLNM